MFIRKRDLDQRLADAYADGFRDGDAGLPFINGDWVDPALVELLPDEVPESGSDYTAFMDPPPDEVVPVEGGGWIKHESEDDGRIGALGSEL